MSLDNGNGMEQRNAATLSAELAAALRELAGQVAGEVLLPGSVAYEASCRAGNAAIDRRPAAIVRCANTEDVVTAVSCARRARLPPAVHSGGLSTIGTGASDGCLVVDLSQMKGLEVDRARGRALAQPGLTYAELSNGLEPYGLAVTPGTGSGTGPPAAALGRGIGWLLGKYGLAIDDILSCEVVTADGECLLASPHENAGLFWGLRGDGGNSGIVTEFELQARRPGPR